MTPVRVLCSIAATVALAGCGADSASTALVPSSFTGLTERIDAATALDTEWVIAGSTRLVRQLADGAQADLLVTADAETMQDAIEQGLVGGRPVVIAENRLVLALAPGNPGALATLGDLADPGLLIGVCAAEVPCGRLAAEAIDALDLAISVDTEEPSVRALALKVSQGELDAGLVYATDAADLGLTTLADEHLAAFVTEYVAATPEGDESDLLSFLRSDEGRAVLVAEGFGLP